MKQISYFLANLSIDVSLTKIYFLFCYDFLVWKKTELYSKDYVMVMENQKSA